MRPVRRLEYALPIAVAGSLLTAVVIVSPHLPMWLDEVYTYYSFAHDSFADFVRSYATGVNTMPPLYFFALWPVFEVVPLSPLALRIVSSIGCGVAVLLVWKTLRGHVGFFAASAATLTAFVTSDVFIAHNSEARYYGIYLALIAWATYRYDRLCVELRPSRSALAWNAVAHALAVSCTYVAGFYSLAILVSLVVRDRVLKLWRPRAYVSVLLGWIPVLLYFPMMWGQRGRGTWMEAPGFYALYEAFRPGYHTYFVLCAFAGLAALALLRSRAPDANAHVDHRVVNERTLHLAIVSFAFLAVPYAMLAFSWAVVPLLLDRYVFPSLIGVAVLLAFVCVAVLGDAGGAVRASAPKATAAHTADHLLRALLIAALVAYPLVRGISTVRVLLASEKDAADDATAPGIVVATSDSHSYYPRYYESGESRRIYYVVRDADRQERLKRFNRRLNPVAIDEFLATHDRFQIVSDNSDREWLEAELRRRGGFRITTELRSGKRKRLTVERE